MKLLAFASCQALAATLRFFRARVPRWRPPETYSTQTTRANDDGTEVKEFVLGATVYAISPAEWDRILSAYTR